MPSLAPNSHEKSNKDKSNKEKSNKEKSKNDKPKEKKKDFKGSCAAPKLPKPQKNDKKNNNDQEEDGDEKSHKEQSNGSKTGSKGKKSRSKEDFEEHDIIVKRSLGKDVDYKIKRPKLGDCEEFVILAGTTVTFKKTLTVISTGSIGTTSENSVSGDYLLRSGSTESGTKDSKKCLKDYKKLQKKNRGDNM